MKKAMTLILISNSVILSTFASEENKIDGLVQTSASPGKAHSDILDFSNQYLGDAGLIANLKSIHNGLKTINLKDNGIDYEGITFLANNMPTELLNLILRDNFVKDKGIIVLAPKLSKTLLKLNLRYCEIGPEGTKYLADHMPPNLEYLNLSYNDIGDKGIRDLADKLSKYLKVLELSNIHTNIEIRFDSFEYLVNHLPANLEAIDLHGNNIGPKATYILSQNFTNDGSGLWKRKIAVK